MLAYSIPFSPERDAEAFARIPVCAGVFLLRGSEEHSEPYVSKAANLRRRIMRLLAAATGPGISKRLNLRDRCATIEFTPTGSDFENIVLLYRTVREVFPESYTRHMRFNFSPLIRIHWENAYPRAYVTRKASRLFAKNSAAAKSVYYGPFQSKAIAEKLLHDALDLFKSRRCTFELNPDPAFPGCVYSEMKMCLAPCFQGCSDEEYMGEVERVQQFLESRGESLLNELAALRDKSSAELNFESSASVHARIEKVKGVSRGFDEIIRRLDGLDAIILQPAAPLSPSPSEPSAAATGEDQVALFRFVCGQILGPALFSFPPPVDRAPKETQLPADHSAPTENDEHKKKFSERPPTAGTKVLESSLAVLIDQLQPAANPTSNASMEQLAILKRWYYRSNRSGEIFFCDPIDKRPLRRILRGVFRLRQKNLSAGEGKEAANRVQTPGPYESRLTNLS